MSNEDIKKYENKHRKQLNKEDLTKHRLLVCSGCSSSENKKTQQELILMILMNFMKYLVLKQSVN